MGCVESSLRVVADEAEHTCWLGLLDGIRQKVHGHVVVLAVVGRLPEVDAVNVLLGYLRGEMVKLSIGGDRDDSFTLCSCHLPTYLNSDRLSPLGGAYDSRLIC